MPKYECGLKLRVLSAYQVLMLPFCGRVFAPSLSGETASQTDSAPENRDASLARAKKKKGEKSGRREEISEQKTA